MGRTGGGGCPKKPFCPRNCTLERITHAILQRNNFSDWWQKVIKFFKKLAFNQIRLNSTWVSISFLFDDKVKLKYYKEHSEHSIENLTFREQSKRFWYSTTMRFLGTILSRSFVFERYKKFGFRVGSCLIIGFFNWKKAQLMRLPIIATLNFRARGHIYTNYVDMLRSY